MRRTIVPSVIPATPPQVPLTEDERDQLRLRLTHVRHWNEAHHERLARNCGAEHFSRAADNPVNDHIMINRVTIAVILAVTSSGALAQPTSTSTAPPSNAATQAGTMGNAASDTSSVLRTADTENWQYGLSTSNRRAS